MTSWVPTTMSISPPPSRATNSAARAGDQMVSRGDDRGARVGEQRRDLVGDALDARAAGDQAVLLAAFGAQALGGGMTWPQWWQARRCISRCSTIQAVQLGHWKRWPQWRHRVSGAKPRRLRNSRRLLAGGEVRLQFGDQARRQPAAARRRVLGQVDRRGSPALSRPAEALGQLELAVAADLDHVAGLDRRRRRGEDDRDVLEMAAHHRDVAGVILDAFLLLEARLMRLVDDDQAEVGDRAGTAPSGRRRRPWPRRWRSPARRGGAARSAGRECQATGSQPKRAAKRLRKGSVSAISGSRTSACLPCRSASAIASK